MHKTSSSNVDAGSLFLFLTVFRKIRSLSTLTVFLLSLSEFQLQQPVTDGWRHS